MWRRALRAGAPRRAGSRAPGRCCSCWSCGAPLGGAAAAGGPGFCPSCRALQPPEARADLFRVLGCPRGFALDLARLRQRFLALQRSLHPDRFSRRPQAERGFSEQHAALINLAYCTLRSPLSRGLYLLELHGVELAAGSDAEAEPGFLAKVLELNEQLAAADSEASLAALERLLAGRWGPLGSPRSGAEAPQSFLARRPKAAWFPPLPFLSSSKARGSVAGGEQGLRAR